LELQLIDHGGLGLIEKDLQSLFSAELFPRVAWNLLENCPMLERKHLVLRKLKQKSVFRRVLSQYLIAQASFAVEASGGMVEASEGKFEVVGASDLLVVGAEWEGVASDSKVETIGY